MIVISGPLFGKPLPAGSIPLKVPEAQVMHDDRSREDFVPAGQGEQKPAPEILLLMNPASHVLQPSSDDAPVSENFPLGHATH